MVKLRLMRMGAKKAPFYRVVATNDNAPRDGRFIEILGFYNPTKVPQIIEIKEDRVTYWLGNGAQPTETVRSLFRKQGILQRMHEAKKNKGAAPETTSEA